MHEACHWLPPFTHTQVQLGSASFHLTHIDIRKMGNKIREIFFLGKCVQPMKFEAPRQCVCECVMAVRHPRVEMASLLFPLRRLCGFKGAWPFSHFVFSDPLHLACIFCNGYALEIEGICQSVARPGGERETPRREKKRRRRRGRRRRNTIVTQ